MISSNYDNYLSDEPEQIYSKHNENYSIHREVSHTRWLFIFSLVQLWNGDDETDLDWYWNPSSTPVIPDDVDDMDYMNNSRSLYLSMSMDDIHDPFEETLNDKLYKLLFEVWWNQYQIELNQITNEQND